MLMYPRYLLFIGIAGSEPKSKRRFDDTNYKQQQTVSLLKMADKGKQWKNQAQMKKKSLAQKTHLKENIGIKKSEIQVIKMNKTKRKFQEIEISKTKAKKRKSEDSQDKRQHIVDDSSEQLEHLNDQRVGNQNIIIYCCLNIF